MWGAVDDEVGYERLAKLQVDHWKAMITQGSTTFRYLNTPKSASTFLMDLIMKTVKKAHRSSHWSKCQI